MEAAIKAFVEKQTINPADNEWEHVSPPETKTQTSVQPSVQSSAEASVQPSATPSAQPAASLSVQASVKPSVSPSMAPSEMFSKLKSMTDLDWFMKIVGEKPFYEAMRPDNMFKDVPAEDVYKLVSKSSNFMTFRNERLEDLFSTLTPDEYAKLVTYFDLEPIKQRLKFQKISSDCVIWIGDHTFGRTYNEFVCLFQRNLAENISDDDIKATKYSLICKKCIDLQYNFYNFSVATSIEKLDEIIVCLPKESQDEWKLVKLCIESS